MENKRLIMLFGILFSVVFCLMYYVLFSFTLGKANDDKRTLYMNQVGLYEKAQSVQDMQEKLDKLAKDFESHKVDSWRSEILEFANSCMNRRKHTKEEFDHIISVHDDYAEYVKTNKIENGQVDLAYEYIEKLYQRCLEKNSFLVVRPDDEDGEE